MKNCVIVNKSGRKDLGQLAPLIQSLIGFAQKRMKFQEPPGLELHSDAENSKNILGKTAHYDPAARTIAIYVDARHPKDILRSIAHELVHHTQNLRGDFAKIGDTGPGYAQKDPHLRGMEEEAYKTGNMCFRDWEDEHKRLQNESKRKNTTMSNLKEQIARVVKKKLQETKVYQVARRSPSRKQVAAISKADKSRPDIDLEAGSRAMGGIPLGKTEEEQGIERKYNPVKRAAAAAAGRTDINEAEEDTKEQRVGLQPAANWHAEPTGEGKDEGDEDTLSKEEVKPSPHGPESKEKHKPSMEMKEMKELEEAVRDAVNSFLDENQVYEINEEESYFQAIQDPDVKPLSKSQKKEEEKTAAGKGLTVGTPLMKNRELKEDNEEELNEIGDNPDYREGDDLQLHGGNIGAPNPYPEQFPDEIPGAGWQHTGEANFGEGPLKSKKAIEEGNDEEKDLKEWYGDQLFESLKLRWTK